jgi:hypothetical protein
MSNNKILDISKNPKNHIVIYKFKAVMEKHESLDAGYIEFLYDVEKEFGVKGQVKVKASFDGYEYRGSLVKMGHDCHWIGIAQKIRAAIKKNPGDTVMVTIEQDVEKHIVKIPPDPLKHFKLNCDLMKYFKLLSYTHQKEYVQWIEVARKPETRLRRIEKTLQMMGKGIKEPR